MRFASSKAVSIALLLATGVSLFSCENSQNLKVCRVGIEDCDGIQVKDNFQNVSYGEDVTFHFSVSQGYTVLGCDYSKEYYLKTSQSNETSLTLKDVVYSSMVTLNIQVSDAYFDYYPNGGNIIGGKETETYVRQYYQHNHLRINTALGTDLFERDGYTFLGWNTKADGSGDYIPSGSRYSDFSGQCFYAMWQEWSDVSLFDFEETVDHQKMIITGYHGKEDVVCLPASYQGKQVISVAEGSFDHGAFDTLVIPSTLSTLEKSSFLNCSLSAIYLYDSISTITDASFYECSNIQTLYINAIEKPVYSTTYYATFQDKYDRLLSLKDSKKIVLWSGSSTRFGYDSERLDNAFPSYDVVNMGVFAYSVTTPEFKLILDCMNEDDILLHSPEFDAAERQFAYYFKLDEPFWNMMEANYETVSHLDMREYTQVFTSFYTYLNTRGDMDKKEYYLSPSDYDEDGNPVSEPSYNQYGDYIVYRPNSDSVLPIYGLEVPYTVGALSGYIPSLKNQYQKYLDKGVKVYYTFSPRNKYALSKESTLEARNELEQYMKDQLDVPFLTSLESSLWEGTYLYGTDNHLSTEGVSIRTGQVIEALNAQMEIDNLEK